MLILLHHRTNCSIRNNRGTDYDSITTDDDFSMNFACTIHERNFFPIKKYINIGNAALILLKYRRSTGLGAFHPIPEFNRLRRHHSSAFSGRPTSVLVRYASFYRKLPSPSMVFLILRSIVVYHWSSREILS